MKHTENITTKRTNRQPGLDILKGTAITGVFLYHLVPSLFPGGFLGVILFFVLSGYLMFVSSMQAETRSGFSAAAYYRKRLLHLYPSLFWMVMLVCCYMTLTHSRHMIGIRRQVLCIFAGIPNWWQISQNASYFTNRLAASPFTHLWYLGVTLQICLLWPLLFWLYRTLSKHHGAQKAAWIFLAPALISGASMVLLYHPGKDPSRVYYGTDTMSFSLFLGMFLGALRQAFPRLKRTRVCQWQAERFLILLLATFLLFVTGNGRQPVMYQGGLFLISVYFCLLIQFTETHKTLFPHLPFAPLAAWLGKTSYLIYLWHYPVIILLLQS